MYSPKSLGKFLLDRDIKAANLITYSIWLSQLTRQIHHILGQPLAEHCQVVNLRYDVLVLQTDSPAWATKLRYLLPEILPKIRALTGLDTIRAAQVKVVPPECVSTKKLPQPNKLSVTSGKCLTSAAHSTPHADLRAALLSLASHALVHKEKT